MELKNVRVYRMVHIGNVPHVLEHGITHKNSRNANNNTSVIIYFSAFKSNTTQRRCWCSSPATPRRADNTTPATKKLNIGRWAA
jgi:hypothetical protein